MSRSVGDDTLAPTLRAMFMERERFAPAQSRSSCVAVLALAASLPANAAASTGRHCTISEALGNAPFSRFLADARQMET